MELRALGSDLPPVPLLGYGCWPLSEAGRPEEQDSVSVIRAALDGGVRLLDTADAYAMHEGDAGHNERLVARALSDWSADRSSLVVATKGGFIRPEGRWVHDGSPEHLRRACHRSLQALGVEIIDLYQLHSPDPKVPFAESLGALAELRAEGKINSVGLSNVSRAQIAQARQTLPVATVQNRLNVYFREALTDGVVEFCRQEGIGFLAYSPLGGGRLNRKLADHHLLQQLARSHRTTPEIVALAWVLAQGDNVIAIPSARRPEHLAANLTVPRVQLAPEDLAAIDQAEFDRS